MPTLRLPVQLTEDERLSRGKRAGELSYDLFQIEEQAKAAKVAIKAQMERLQGEIADLHNQLRTGKEWREVEIDLQKDLGRRLELTVRLDTGEVVSTRPLGPDEMQGELSLVEKESEPIEETPAESQQEEQQQEPDDGWIDDEQFGEDEIGEQVDDDEDEEYTGPPDDAPDEEKLAYLRNRVKNAREKARGER